MSYIERLMIPDEVVLHQARRSLYPTFAGPALALVAALAAGVALSVLRPPGPSSSPGSFRPFPSSGSGGGTSTGSTRSTWSTNRRVLSFEGLFTKVHRDASLDKINDMNLEQGLLGRLLDYGDLGIATANESASVTYHFLHDPVEFKKQALMSREAARPSATPAARPRPRKPTPSRSSSASARCGRRASSPKRNSRRRRRSCSAG